MGQRANYILIENNKRVIHYNHWRANCIAADLYLGEKRFIEFVKSCRLADVLLNEVWIEGCVIIDTDERKLYFWSLEFGVTSATNFYLKELQDKWGNWAITLLYNQMYDVEQILNIDYIAHQEQFPLSINTTKEIISDELSEFGNAVIIIKTPLQTHITQLGDVSVDGILNYGESVVGILLNKNQYELPKEEDDKVFETLIIDTVNKELIIDKSEFGLWEQCQSKWRGYGFKMGDFGYLGTLKLAGIEVEGLAMSPESIKVEFANLVKPSDDFDPNAMAKMLLNEDKDIKFSQGFFDSVKPKRTIIEKIIRAVYKLIGFVKQ
jgi:hypothetical protein